MDPTRLIDDLNTGATYWRHLSKAQRRAVVAAVLARLATDHGIMDSATWDRVKPRWAPKTGSMHGAIGVSLGRLVSDAGMRTGRNSHITCDCGRLWTHAVEIQVVNSNGTEIAETLRLCDACYAEFVAMEAAYA